MKTLVIYDNSGNVFSKITGSYLIPKGGIQFMEVETPEGKQVAGVNTSVTPHKAILEDIPPSEIDVLKQENMDLNLAIAEIVQASENDKIETQLAIAELANLIIGGNA